MNLLSKQDLQIIAEHTKVSVDDITDITILKKGMTNRSFTFKCKDKRYIMRIPGEGTESLVNRKNEAAVYHAISGLGLCDDPIYINPENGYKLTRYLEKVRSCDAYNEKDIKRAMEKLKTFHEMKIIVDFDFDLYERIEFYERLWEGKSSVYRDYKTTKDNVYNLRDYIKAHRGEMRLTHIDAIADNFLFYGEDEGPQLTDWEYAGMQDPHLDLAMFSIYSFYDRSHIDHLIDVYFGEDGCDQTTRIKIYCYVATGGLLWSNWCEYKRNIGVEFGEYSIRQYRYAKDFYKIAVSEIGRLENEEN